ncbi:MAG TPA: YCF48-related protein [Acidimicrobiia bacterium]|nr:YCF48-related protein [Acidimicrobiia bacterium]
MLWRLVALGLVVTACSSSGSQRAGPRPLGTTTSTGPTTTTSTATPAGAPGDCPRLEPVPTYDRVEALTSIQMVSDRPGWAVGSGVIIHTDDGRSWTEQYRGPEEFIFVNAVDATHAWAVGTHELFGTSDGGRTWNRLASAPEGLTVVHFAGPNLGWGVAGDKLFHTTDGGQNWQPLETPCGAQEVCFTGPDDGWIAAGDRIWRSTDAGATWAAALDVPAPPRGSGGLPVKDLQCARPGVVWAYFAGTDGVSNHRPYVAFRGSASGEWTPVMKENYTGSADVEAPQGGSYPGPFSSLGPHEAVFITYTPPVDVPVGVVLASQGGRKLGPGHDVPGLDGAYSTSFRSPQVGWVVGPTPDYYAGVSLILATTDGGRTWEEQYRSARPRPRP